VSRGSWAGWFRSGRAYRSWPAGPGRLHPRTQRRARRATPKVDPHRCRTARTAARTRPRSRTGCVAGCFPCRFPHATPACAANECAIKDCEPGWADLDGLADNGCESNITGPTNCTAANLDCTSTGELCAPTGCVATCPPLLTNCGGACVDLSTSPEYCGSCSQSCDLFDYGVATCSDGICGTCTQGSTLCDGECTDTTHDPQNCGACGSACLSEDFDEQVSLLGRPVPPTAICEDSHCIDSCSPGWTSCRECDSGGALGIVYCDQECVVTATDVNNCGACNQKCVADQVCVQGACVPATSIWLATGLASPEGIVIDTDTAYFTDPGAGTVGSVPKAGGEIAVLATGQTQPASIRSSSTPTTRCIGPTRTARSARRLCPEPRFDGGRSRFGPLNRRRSPLRIAAPAPAADTASRASGRNRICAFGVHPLAHPPGSENTGGACQHPHSRAPWQTEPVHTVPSAQNRNQSDSGAAIRDQSGQG
jgi:hypothetical protein